MRRFRARLRNNKGFTLIELMATLVILALIIAIAVPAVGNITSKAKDSSDKSSIALMERAGEMAELDGLDFDSGIEADSYLIGTLIDAGYLKLEKDSPFNNGTNYVKKVNKSGKFVFNGEGSGTDSGNDTKDSKYRPFVTEMLTAQYMDNNQNLVQAGDYWDLEDYGDGACANWNDITDETVAWHHQDFCSNYYEGLFVKAFTGYFDVQYRPGLSCAYEKATGFASESDAYGYMLLEDTMDALVAQSIIGPSTMWNYNELIDETFEWMMSQPECTADYPSVTSKDEQLKLLINAVIAQMEVNNDYVPPYAPF